MENNLSVPQASASSLSDRFGQFAIPALHLWWRFFWRTLILPVAIVLAIATVALVSENLTAGHREFGFAGAFVGMGLFWLFFMPIMVVYGIWLMRRTILLKPFLYHGTPHTFVVSRQENPLSLPLPLESAMAIWWGVVWRAWVGMMVTMMAFFFLGPLHFFLQAGISYFAFLWLLAAPYGSTRITVRSLS